MTQNDSASRSDGYGYIQGETMGTSYHIRYQLPEHSSPEDIQASIDRRLDAINASMSTYQTDSTISEFNRLPAHTPMTIDADFIHVFNDAKQVYQQSAGAFDPTVLPLLETWGFGYTMRVDRLQSPPSADDIATAKALIDFDGVTLDGEQLQKSKEGVALDFSAIAKGYGVDVIAQVLHEEYQIANYMVEIGGEVATRGINDKHQPWQIAIDAPVLDSSVVDRDTIAILRQPLDDQRQGSMHLATSGNYRNSIVLDGTRYSHTIDPKTGSPIVGGAPSVSVIAETVALADAWATALTAMPYEEALATAEAQNLAVLFVILDPKADPSSETHRKSDWQVVQTRAMQALRES